MRYSGHAFIALSMLVCVACGKPSEEAATAADRAEPVVIYASQDDDERLSSLFAEFTRDSGIRVTVRNADAATIVDDIINDRGSPPADVLLSSDVLGVWRAADEGALRPFVDETLVATAADKVPDHLRDPDGFWVAATVRPIAIVYDSRTIDPAGLAGYESLADTDHAGSVCLASSSLSINRTLIAMLIDELGVRPAEVLVRDWMKNLELPVFDTEATLLAAIDSGRCALGIAALRETQADANVQFFVPDGAFVDIEGFGVARHAREPQSAQQLIAWYLSSQDVVSTTHTLSPKNVGIAAWRAEDARKLAERAAYR